MFNTYGRAKEGAAAATTARATIVLEEYILRIVKRSVVLVVKGGLMRVVSWRS